MKNLACSKPTDERLAAIDAEVLRELSDAGIVYYEAGRNRSSECPTVFGGRFTVGPYTITLWRAWCYWVADCVPALPIAVARKINDAPHEGPRGHYCGNVGTLGDVVRVDGFAGGHEPLKWGSETVNHWNIDTEEGLKAFVVELRKAVGQ